MNVVFDSERADYRCSYCGKTFSPEDKRIVTGNGEIESGWDLFVEHPDCYQALQQK